MARLRAEDAAALRDAAGQRGDLEPARRARGARTAACIAGSRRSHTYLRARRQVLYASFLRLWQRVGREQLASDLPDRLGGGRIGGRDG